MIDFANMLSFSQFLGSQFWPRPALLLPLFLNITCWLIRTLLAGQKITDTYLIQEYFVFYLRPKISCQAAKETDTPKVMDTPRKNQLHQEVLPLSPRFWSVSKQGKRSLQSFYHGSSQPNFWGVRCEDLLLPNPPQTLLPLVPSHYFPLSSPFYCLLINTFPDVRTPLPISVILLTLGRQHFAIWYLFCWKKSIFDSDIMQPRRCCTFSLSYVSFILKPITVCFDNEDFG